MNRRSAGASAVRACAACIALVASAPSDASFAIAKLDSFTIRLEGPGLAYLQLDSGGVPLMSYQTRKEISVDGFVEVLPSTYWEGGFSWPPSPGYRLSGWRANLFGRSDAEVLQASRGNLARARVGAISLGRQGESIELTMEGLLAEARAFPSGDMDDHQASFRADASWMFEVAGGYIPPGRASDIYVSYIVNGVNIAATPNADAELQIGNLVTTRCRGWPNEPPYDWWGPGEDVAIPTETYNLANLFASNPPVRHLHFWTQVEGLAEAHPIPEPGAIVLLGLGGVALGTRRRAARA